MFLVYILLNNGIIDGHIRTLKYCVTIYNILNIYEIYKFLSRNDIRI